MPAAPAARPPRRARPCRRATGGESGRDSIRARPSASSLRLPPFSDARRERQLRAFAARVNPLATRECVTHIRHMLNLLSILLGLVALLLAIPSAVPFLGWGNWI